MLRFPHSAGLRPTPDRLRETLFNWLGQTLDGLVCLDLFAGSGALGLEAASRGARAVTLVEREPPVCRALEESIRLLGATQVEILQTDAFAFLNIDQRCFDIVFLDPPFESGLLARVAPELPRLTRQGGMAYIESAEGIELPAPWQLYRQGRAGQVTFQLFSHGNH